MLKIKFHGAAGTVTGSKTEIEYKHSKYLVDCGLFQGMKEIRDLNWQEVKNARDYRAIILSHAHIDHSGYIPKFCNEGFKGNIFCSNGTKELCQILLPDSGYLQEEDAMFANKTKHSKHDPALPLYTEADAKKSLQQLNPVEMNKWVPLDPGISFRFLRAGHILGSCIVQFSVELENGSKIITFTGDLGNGRSHILESPELVSETDFLIAESTYGDRRQQRNTEFDEMELIINKVIKRGGTLVIPAFAVGRTQELIYIISRLEKEKRIPKVPVYLDSPMAQDVTEIYSKHHDEIKKELSDSQILRSVICTECFQSVNSSDESMLLCMNDDPKIVISAAGMLTGGRVLHHLRMKLPHEKNGVLFVGFQASGTKGLLLKNGLRKIRIHHQEVDVEAEVFSLESLSAHADSDDMIAWMKNIKKAPEKTFVNHGEVNASFALKYRIETELGWLAQVPALGQEFDLT